MLTPDLNNVLAEQKPRFQQQKKAHELLPQLNLPRKLRMFLQHLHWQTPEVGTGIRVGSEGVKMRTVGQQDLDEEAVDFVQKSIFSTCTNRSFFQELHIALHQTIHFIDIPAGKQRTVHLHTTPGTHTVIRVGSGADVTLIETGEKPASPYATTNGVELFQDSNSHVRYLYTQTSDLARQIQIRNAFLAQDASITWYPNLIGGIDLYHEINTILFGEHATNNLSGTYFTSAKEQVHMYYSTEHRNPNTTNNIFVHGVSAEQSFSNFYGNIQIGSEARGTDTHLTESCLLLTKQAKHDTMPTLEINTNDVKATHSAGVTQIDEAYLFYTKSRGIPEAEAKQMIISSFLESVYGTIPVEEEKERVKQLIAKKYDTLGK